MLLEKAQDGLWETQVKEGPGGDLLFRNIKVDMEGFSASRICSSYSCPRNIHLKMSLPFDTMALAVAIEPKIITLNIGIILCTHMPLPHT